LFLGQGMSNDAVHRVPIASVNPLNPMRGASPMASSEDTRRQRQLDAIWKWRWLGWRDSTPAFKASIALLALLALALVVVASR